MAIQWWAHRGAGKGAFENTMKGFQTAVDSGFQAIEFDVMCSADGVVMVHHDWLMGRCATPIHASENATANGMPYFDTLSAKTIIENFSVQGEPVPTFDELVQFCLQHRLVANVELKARSPKGARLLGQRVCELMLTQSDDELEFINAHWVFSSFYHASLLPLSELTPRKLPRMLKPKPAFQLALLYEYLADDWVIRADALGAKAIHLHFTGATTESIRRIHTTGRRVRVYTVNSLEEAVRLRSLGVEGVFTDRMEFAGLDP